jgi:copper chaperone
MAAQTKFRISGMTCAHCVKAVKSALESIAGVESAEVSLERGDARVIHDGSLSSEEAIAKVREEGYEAETAE